MAYVLGKWRLGRMSGPHADEGKRRQAESEKRNSATANENRVPSGGTAGTQRPEVCRL